MQDQSKKDRVYELWRAGRSAGQIAAQVAITRSAVAGIVDRAGLKRGPKTSRIAPPLVMTPVANGDGLTLLELAPNQCRWPIMNGMGPARFACAYERLRGFSYCAIHARKAHTHIASSGTRGFLSFGRNKA